MVVSTAIIFGSLARALARPAAVRISESGSKSFTQRAPRCRRGRREEKTNAYCILCVLCGISAPSA